VEEIKYLLEQILLNQKEHKEAIEALKKKIEDTHDPVLQTLLEMIVQVKHTSSPIQDLLNKAKNKTS
jgi:hypothetical protein